MFESMKNAAKLASVMKDLPKIKARMGEVRDEMGRRSVQATAGGGAVTATVSGKLQVVSIELSPALVAGIAGNDATARGYAESLLVEAVNGALQKAQQMVADALHAAARDLDLPLPEGMLGELMGG